jgi:putative cell wall-binding protein
VRGFVLLSIMVGFGLAALLLMPRAAAAGVMTERVSLTTAGTQVMGENSFDACITPSGRWVVFTSYSDDLVPNDTNGKRDVFVRDLVLGITSRISRTSAGGNPNDYSYEPSISDDGNFVTYSSGAFNIVAGDTNGVHDVFVYNRAHGTTTRVSVATGGAQAVGGDSGYSRISGDGRYVVFQSDATNLVDDDTNGAKDIFVHDRDTGNTTRWSVATGGAQANGDSRDASISRTGYYVAFESQATNLVSGDTNGSADVFVRTRGILAYFPPSTARVSVSSAEAQANDDTDAPSISADGRYVAFESYASNLVAGDTNGVGDVFVRDRVAGTTRRVSVATTGAQANGTSDYVSISPDGRYVAFSSLATNFVAGDTNTERDVFVHDTLRRTTRRASVSTSGVQANDRSFNFSRSITADGMRVAFHSQATNLVTGDTNAATDVFVRTGPSSVARLSDRTRFSTAVAIARDGFPAWGGVKHVVIASGDDRAAADPLAASGLCWAYDAPMLLVSAARTPDEVKVALKEIVTQNGSITLHVVGGPISVPDARLNDIKAYVGAANITVDRILSTGSRYDLAAAIALRMKSARSSTMPKVALFANGADPAKFFDALALSPISAGTGAPILLVTATNVPAATANAVTTLAPTTKIVGGGPLTVSNAVVTQLGATRWSGQSRYDTAIAIADGAVSKDWLTRSYVGLAAKLPDALTGGSLMGRRDGVLLLTDGANLSAPTKTWLTSHKMSVSEVCVFGGPLSISDAVKTQVGNALK